MNTLTLIAFRNYLLNQWVCFWTVGGSRSTCRDTGTTYKLNTKRSNLSRLGFKLMTYLLWGSSGACTNHCATVQPAFSVPSVSHSSLPIQLYLWSTFNNSRVDQGALQQQKRTLESVHLFIGLWVHPLHGHNLQNILGVFIATDEPHISAQTTGN